MKTEVALSRRSTSSLHIGSVGIGSNFPVSIQTMLNMSTKETQQCLEKIHQLQSLGVDLVRISVLDPLDIKSLKPLIQESPLPLVADIHFNEEFAIEAMNVGIQGLRLNPGNIKDKNKVKAIVHKAKDYHIPIRIGVNGGSLDPGVYSSPSPKNMVQSAMNHVQILEDLNFDLIKVSLKSSDVRATIEANRQFAKLRNYPLHLGITEAGSGFTSAVRSSMGIGTLLMEGIGDTIRVSSSGDLEEEIRIARDILLTLELTKGIYWIACPTCGRTTLSVNDIVQKLQNEFFWVKKTLTICIMGCVVNGIGEAGESDIGIVGGLSESRLYIRGKFVEKIQNKDVFPRLRKEIYGMLEEDNDISLD